ncbi:cytochrome d ubiquinol oxidase subunit II [Phenylobacterium deserti]|uniref:Cytochrome d ubiquinol oxidase subunit II n=1 Tax=Phenylobacterium deserti TaxID=1914756 RepID=A0A328ARB3_9CAUL|nr:cytochrome d ubiquinol oxidase subunit II [Phenylobacterium deserti]
MSFDVTTIWAGVIAFVIFMYVLLDGFDLGLGMLFPFMKDERERDIAMNSVAPIWDFNETWLVLGAAGLFGAFPMAYAALLPAFYLPILVMLIALVFRGVAFEFRFKVHAHKGLWSKAFFFGSLFATFTQGVVLGAFVQGVPVRDGQYTGGAFDWLSPFSLLTGVALVAGYGLLGATWLVAKSTGDLHDWAQRTAIRLLFAVILFMGLVSAAVPLLDTDIAQRWFAWPNILYLSPIPLLVAAVGFELWRSLQHASGRVIRPFLLAMTLFLLGFLGLAISLWPNLIPPDISIYEAAAPRSSQVFLLVGMLALLPVLLGYVAYTYWVFRGKIGDDVGYDH